MWSIWMLKPKPEVKLLTLMWAQLIFRAQFLQSGRKGRTGICFSLIYQSRLLPSAAARYNWHSSYQKALQDSHSKRLALSCRNFATQSCFLSGTEPIRIYTWQFKDLEKRRISSFKFRVQDWNRFFSSYFLFLISHLTVKRCFANLSQELGCAHGG